MGLTMAEIMVLVIFALLLILARAFADESGKTLLPRPFAALMETWKSQYPGENDFDDRAQHLVWAADAGGAMLDGLGEGSKGREKGKFGSPQASRSELDTQVARLKALVEAGQLAEKAVGQNKMGMTARDSAMEFLKVASNAFEKARSANRYGSSRIWLEDVLRRADTPCDEGGRGTEHPPCSATNGEPDFVFDVRLGSTRITVKDNDLPHLADRRREWPTSRIRFGEAVSRSMFLTMTQDLFRWSQQRQCRFFVRIVDETLAHEKRTYKIQLRTVGSHFYYWEPINEGSQGRS